MDLARHCTFWGALIRDNKGNLTCFLPQKLQERRSVFKKRVYTNNEDKEKWLKVLVPDMISSEESEEDDDGDFNVVKTLPWRAVVVRDFFYDLDEHYYSGKSPQAKRQTKRRALSDEVSSRSLPVDHFPSWAISNTVN